jgi:hypothetical protein
MPKGKPQKFKAELMRSPFETGWHFLLIEAKHGEKFEKKNGSRRVVCTINGALSFQCALLPWEGNFTIIVNKTKRDKLGIVAGDKVTVELAKDESKYGLPMPPELKEVLKQDRKGDKLFHKLTAGKQRSILYWVGQVKDIDKRIYTALVFIEHLKKNEGKIVPDELTSELKRPLF